MSYREAHRNAHCAARAAACAGALRPSHADAGPIALKRGVSIHEWLNWSPLDQSGAYQWPPYRPLKDWGSVRDFERIKAMGFDFVRLSVDPGPLLAADGRRRSRRARAARARRPHRDRDWPQSRLRPAPGQPGQSLVGPGHRGLPASSRTATMPWSPAQPPCWRVSATDRTALELMNEPQFYPCDGAGGAPGRRC